MHIKVKARCILRKGDEVLLEHRLNSTSGVEILRPPGGNIEFGEASRDAISREILEECDEVLQEIRLLGTIEELPHTLNGFEHIVHFLYAGVVADEKFYESDTVRIQEGGNCYDATWVNIHRLTSVERQSVQPVGLLELLGVK